MALADDMNNVSYEELQEIVLKIDGIDLNDLCFLEKTVPVIQAIQPKNYNEFKRSVALAMGVGTWVDSGEVVFKDEKTDVNGLIAFKSDILTHLKSHHVEDGIANEIANKIATGFIAKRCMIFMMSIRNLQKISA